MAAGNTYEAIAVYTTANATTNSLTFNSIPSTYTDLVLVASVLGATNSGWTATVRFNGDSGNNYSFTQVIGNGTAASSIRSANASSFQFAGAVGGLSTTNPITGICSIQNYANTTTYKTAIGRDNDSSGTVATVALWRNTAAINSITVFLSNTSYYFANNSVFSLYGIKAA
jgi:hypothetical protein